MDANNGLRYSAVLIAYNEEAHIMDAIQSLKAQSVPPYRIVVVDDGSTDGTPGLLAEAGVTVITLPKHDGSVLHNSPCSLRTCTGLAYFGLHHTCPHVYQLVVRGHLDPDFLYHVLPL